MMMTGCLSSEKSLRVWVHMALLFVSPSVRGFSLSFPSQYLISLSQF